MRSRAKRFPSKTLALACMFLVGVFCVPASAGDVENTDWEIEMQLLNLLSGVGSSNTTSTYDLSFGEGTFSLDNTDSLASLSGTYEQDPSGFYNFIELSPDEDEFAALISENMAGLFGEDDEVDLEVSIGDLLFDLTMSYTSGLTQRLRFYYYTKYDVSGTVNGEDFEAVGYFRLYEWAELELEAPTVAGESWELAASQTSYAGYVIGFEETEEELVLNLGEEDGEIESGNFEISDADANVLLTGTFVENFIAYRSDFFFLYFEFDETSLDDYITAVFENRAAAQDAEEITDIEVTVDSVPISRAYSYDGIFRAYWFVFIDVTATVDGEEESGSGYFRIYVKGESSKTKVRSFSTPMTSVR